MIDRCAATSFNGRGEQYEQRYGPGGTNRCVNEPGHNGRHTDEFGQVFTERRPPAGEQDDRCPETSFNYGRGRGEQYEQRYGPGGFNRCVKEPGHGLRHTDEFGQVFNTDPWRLLTLVYPSALNVGGSAHV